MDSLVSSVNNELTRAVFVGSALSHGSIDASDSSLVKDLSSAITVGRSGKQLLFASNKAGDRTALSVAGGSHNKLGFSSANDVYDLMSYGKDDTFELGFNNFDVKGHYLVNSITSTVNYSTPNFLYVNDKLISFNISSSSSTTQVEFAIDEALSREFGDQITAEAEFDPKTKRLALRFVTQNSSYDSSTRLTLSTGGSSAFSTNIIRNVGYNYERPERRLQDFAEFIENFYEGGASVDIVDGKLLLKDRRKGSSALDFSMTPDNSGIEQRDIPSDVYYLSGNYLGSSDLNLDIRYDMVDMPNGTKEMHLRVVDDRGVILRDDVYKNYRGQSVEVAPGVLFAPVQTTATPQTQRFNLSLHGDNGINLGRMNVLKDGDNADVFNMLSNLRDALKYNVPHRGVTKPSSWDEHDDKDSASPYFDGDFTGDYNDRLKFSVDSEDSKSRSYLQSEQLLDLGTFEDFDFDKGILDFSVNVWDNAEGEFHSVRIDSASGSLNINSNMSTLEIENSIMSAVNNDGELTQLGVSAYFDEDNHLILKSGAGTHTLSIGSNNDASELFLNHSVKFFKGAVTPELDIDNSALGTIHYFNPESKTWFDYYLEVPPKHYSSLKDLSSAINTAIHNGINGSTGLGNLFNIKLVGDKFELETSGYKDPVSSAILSAQSSNSIPFKFEGYFEAANSELGLRHRGTEFIEPVKDARLDLKNTKAEARTLSFDYYDGLGVRREYSLSLDERVYHDLGDIIDSINEKLKKRWH